MPAILGEEPNPLALLTDWYRAAQAAGEALPEAVMLATVDAAGPPHARVVLLKSSVEALRETSELCFFTNYNSPKSRELANEPRATLVFYWSSLARQVRVEGRTRRCSEQESDEYFASRPRGHQIGAWASAQSEPITSRDELIARVT